MLAVDTLDAMHDGTAALDLSVERSPTDVIEDL
jgi:hypothetical protein